MQHIGDAFYNIDVLINLHIFQYILKVTICRETGPEYLAAVFLLRFNQIMQVTITFRKTVLCSSKTSCDIFPLGPT